MAPQAPGQKHTSVIDLDSGFSDGGSEYWPEDSSYDFKPNDNYYHRSLASQWMDSIGLSRKGTSAVFVICMHTPSYHITFINRCSKICSHGSIDFSVIIEPMSFKYHPIYCSISHKLTSTCLAQASGNPVRYFLSQLIDFALRLLHS